MKQTSYNFKIKYHIVNFDKVSSNFIETLMKRCKQLLTEELMHCICPLKMHLSMSADFDTDDELYLHIICKDIITEDTIDTNKLKEHLRKKFNSIVYENTCCYLKDPEIIMTANR